MESPRDRTGDVHAIDQISYDLGLGGALDRRLVRQMDYAALAARRRALAGAPVEPFALMVALCSTFF
jgi:hypothetical protein